MSAYFPTMGLEIHAELLTISKVFCTCSAEFGGTPNSRCCPVCSGLPGTLPVLNQKAVEYIIKAGYVMNCDISRFTKWDRKNYFYPDLPKAYQISQMPRPVCLSGTVNINVNGEDKVIRINRIHLEEDAGKLVHDDVNRISLADYNRCGVPLIEIVTEPDFHSADEVIAFIEKIKLLLQYAGICDCKMEQGSIRCDVNISIAPKGSTELGTRTELKNLNSFRHVQKAIEYEIARQEDVILDGGKVRQETRLYDSVKNITLAMRSKEDAEDYRYFPDPDLLPVCISDEELALWKSQMPELPAERKKRFQTEWQIAESEAELIAFDPYLTGLLEKSAELYNEPKKIANLILGPLLREMNQRIAEGQDGKLAIEPKALAELAKIIDSGLISFKIAADIFPDLVNGGVMPEALVKERGLVQVSDTGAIEAAVLKVIAANPAEVEAYKGGKTKLIGFFVGQIMREMKGKANPAVVNELLAKHLS